MYEQRTNDGPIWLVMVPLKVVLIRNSDGEKRRLHSPYSMKMVGNFFVPSSFAFYFVQSIFLCLRDQMEEEGSLPFWLVMMPNSIC